MDGAIKLGKENNMPEDTMTHMIEDFILHLLAAGRATSTIACYQQISITLLASSARFNLNV